MKYSKEIVSFSIGLIVLGSLMMVSHLSKKAIKETQIDSEIIQKSTNENLKDSNKIKNTEKEIVIKRSSNEKQISVENNPSAFKSYIVNIRIVLNKETEGEKALVDFQKVSSMINSSPVVASSTIESLKGVVDNSNEISLIDIDISREKDE